MPVIDPLRNPFYQSGGLVQQREACQWPQRGHQIEVVDCPLCGQALGSALALTFGGIGVVHFARNFDVHTRYGGWVSLEQNDLPEIVQFICRQPSTAAPASSYSTSAHRVGSDSGSS